MENFIIKNIANSDIVSELEKIGYDSSYRHVAAEKFEYKTIKIYDLNPAQANILKQTALSTGTDCATARDVITGKAEISNAILTGSISELKKIAQKLEHQPFGLKTLGQLILEELMQRKVTTKLAGIVNVTPDSFSDGGEYFAPEAAIAHAMQLVEDGADMLDIGAESTRPFSEAVPAEEQINRLKPVLKKISELQIPISVDTRSSAVAEFALNNGASVINDVSGFDFDTSMPEVIGKYNAGVIIQHSKGTPQDMQINPTYKDVVEDIYFSLAKKVNLAQSKGITNIIVDVGIGFGKTQQDNFELLNRIEEFYSLKLPVMVGVSRKSLLGLQNSTDNNLKDAMTLAISYPLIQKKVDFLRVHNVKLHKQLLNLAV